jgi:hypothetical protein
VNCYARIDISSCLSSDIEGVGTGVEDRLATNNEVVLGAGVIFLFSHKKVKLLLSSLSVLMFVKDISGALLLSLYLVFKNCSPFSLSTDRLDDCSGIGTVEIGTFLFRAVFLLHTLVV